MMKKTHSRCTPCPSQTPAKHQYCHLVTLCTGVLVALEDGLKRVRQDSQVIGFGIGPWVIRLKLRNWRALVHTGIPAEEGFSATHGASKLPGAETSSMPPRQRIICLYSLSSARFIRPALFLVGGHCRKSASHAKLDDFIQRIPKSPNPLALPGGQLLVFSKAPLSIYLGVYIVATSKASHQAIKQERPAHASSALAVLHAPRTEAFLARCHNSRSRQLFLAPRPGIKPRPIYLTIGVANNGGSGGRGLSRDHD